MARKDAYRKAFGREDMDDVAASKAASKAAKRCESLAKVREIRGRVEEAAAEEEDGLIYSKVDCMRLLTEMVRTSLEEGDRRTAIRAINELSKMGGYHEAQRVEVKEDYVTQFIEREIRGAMEEPMVRQHG